MFFDFMTGVSTMGCWRILFGVFLGEVLFKQ